MPETCGSPAALGPGIGGPFPTAGVIDPHTVTRVALPLVLPEFDWVDAGATVADFLAARPAVDVVLLAVHRDGADGAPFTAWTRAVRSLVRAGYPVCLLTSERSPVMLHGCLTAGARAVAHSTDPLDDLRAAVRAAADGRLWVTDSLAPLANLSSSRPNLPSLTERQRVILSARARGEKFDSIARRLFISRKVAEEHWAAVARKYASFLRDHSPADLERLLGLEPVDLTDPPADLLAG
jgi:two-component system nitrate/nitrite response regulator NarL